MTCLPDSGGCERTATDAFINHFNRVTGAGFVHEACLDRMDSSSPQPEALYLDREKNRKLVVERKSISWPSDYPYRHSNDHLVSSIFTQALRGLPFEDLYELKLPLLVEGREQELRPFAEKGAAHVQAHWSQVTETKRLRGSLGGKWSWTFSRVPDWDREDEAPHKGLKISFIGRPMALEEYLDPTSLPDELVAALGKIYASCSKKFATYHDAKRILVLDPHGDLRYKDADWWQEVFANLPPPPAAEEIWSGIFDSVDDYSEGWMFERLR